MDNLLLRHSTKLRSSKVELNQKMLGETACEVILTLITTFDWILNWNSIFLWVKIHLCSCAASPACAPDVRIRPTSTPRCCPWTKCEDHDLPGPSHGLAAYLQPAKDMKEHTFTDAAHDGWWPHCYFVACLQPATGVNTYDFTSSQGYKYILMHAYGCKWCCWWPHGGLVAFRLFAQKVHTCIHAIQGLQKHTNTLTSIHHRPHADNFKDRVENRHTHIKNKNYIPTSAHKHTHIYEHTHQRAHAPPPTYP